MTEAAVVIAVFVLGLVVASTLVNRSGNAQMGVAPIRPRVGLPYRHPASRLPYYPLPVPDDATHVAWVMMGQGQNGTVYSLAVQDILAAEMACRAARHTYDPVIQQMIVLESDLVGRGCNSTGDLRFCLARVDDEGTEHWWSGSRWVKRWHRDAALFDVWGERA
jgi:hypothetical protein